MPLSSAFLYVGIVAIWAFVLVPRWLRRPQSLPEPIPAFEADYSQDADYDEDTYEQAVADDGRTSATAAAATASRSDPPRPAAEPWPAAAAPWPAAAEPGPAGAEPWPGGAEPWRAAAESRSMAVLPRSRVLQARRRLLTLLVVLCAAAAACTVLKLTSWWACVPPAGMLGMYLLLLREAALADAEQARRRAAMELRVQTARQRAHTVPEETAEEHSAEIIDISARVGDQLYDQYADATIRAVGD